MKPRRPVLFLGALAALVATSALADKYKANNTLSLNQAGSWTNNAVPGSTEYAVWAVTVTSANTTNSLGANLTWGGIKIQNPGGPVTLTSGNSLALAGVGGTGIDMSGAIKDLTFNCSLGLLSSQAWNISAGRSLFAGAPISGSGSLTKTGGGLAILAATNTYAGSTVVSSGTLQVNGSLPSTSTVSVQNGATLSGIGNIGGAVNLQTGGFLQPGINGIGSLTIGNTLSLSGTTLMEVSKAPLSNDLVRGVTTVTYGGTLSVTNLPGTTLAAGDCFRLFVANSYIGSFSTIVPTVPGPGLYWDTSRLNQDGTLCVTSLPLQLSCATNKTVDCNYTWSFDPPTAISYCGGTNVFITVLYTTTQGVCPKIVTRTWMATNSCAQVTCSQTVTVTDTTPPVFICGSNKTVSCSANWSFDPPTAFDGCSGTNVTISILNTVTNGKCPQFITRTWLATDACGNSNTCSQAITEVTEPPTLRCPADIDVAATSPEGAHVSYTVFTAGGCSSNFTLVCTPPPGSLFPVGTTAVTCVATDSCGNRASCSFLVRVTANNCCDKKSWSQAEAQGPSPRSGHAMASDVDGSGVLLFGGNDGNLRGDTWRWGGTNWQLRAAEGPAPRQFTALAYDSVRNVVVLFGGAIEGTTGAIPLGDTWEWDGTAWHAIQVAGPPARHSHAMAYDPNRHRVVLYGGIKDATSELQDTWEYDGASWVAAASAIPSPGPRAAHAMGWDGSHMVLFAGDNQGTVRGDTWSWFGDRWLLVATNGPSARAHHALAYDGYCNRLVLYGGGTSANSVSGDTWEWDGAAWSFKSDTDPSARWQHAMAHDAAHGQTVVFGGGRGTQGRLGDTWLRMGDQTPPHLVSVYGACNDTEICLTFDEPISPETALKAANYLVSCGAAPNPVLTISQSDDGRMVCLTLAVPIGVGCVLVIQNLEDLCGNALRLSQTSFECTQEPCPKGTAGTEFWLTFPGNYAPDPTNAPSPRLYVTGAPGTFVSVGAPGLTPPYVAWGNIPPGGELTFTLPRSADLGETNEAIQPKGIHVMAAGQVAVYGMNHVQFTSDAYLGLPKSTLGKAYIVLSYQDAFSSVPELNGSEFALVGTENGTTVTVLPSVDVGLHAAGLPFNFTLNRGQTWQLRNTNGLPADFTGSIVVADKPVAVFAGHACASVPSGDYFFCDHLVEQMFPTEYWGKNFVTMPLAGRFKGDTFRIMALFNGTTIMTNGTAIPGSLNQGKFFEIQLRTPSTLSASGPVLVAQYADSSDYDLVDVADPFMVLVLPTSMTSSKFVVQSPTSGFSDNYINLYTTSVGVGAIQVGPTTVPAGSYVNIAGSAWYGAKVAVATGTHVLQSTNGAVFGAVVYGWDLFDAYGYPAGFCNPPRDTKPPQFTCPPTNVLLQLDADCTASVPDLRTQVGNASSAVAILQDPAPGSRVGPGPHTVTTTAIDPYGNRQICTTVLDSAPRLSCPGNIVTNCTGPNGTVVTYQVGVCDTNSLVSCEPPSGSPFPIGLTTVNCVAVTPGQPGGGGLNGYVTCKFTVQVICTHLDIAQVGANLALSWGGVGTLLTATSLAGPWQTISNAPNPYVLPHTEKQRYFRVQQ